ncbi:hypothetical protein AMS68_000699 [Peltaster fructicola]|uniref:Actin-like ATPase domain-containing protein n=1 Tax=Peltaster fructicola TaxID=286661 RepID=A0A6H0XKC3_9PEZI|nr:hypothetical protein AMS68_000699 [Peltaster fructicola]
MPLFKDDQILIIAPGSQTTLAQLGLPESYTPARYRLRSCMFAAEKAGEYEPIKIRKKLQAPAPAQPQTNGDATNGEQPEAKAEEPEWEEDRLSEEGAIWPIQGGRIVDWPCFYALMDHVYKTINPSFHTPILLIAQPIWTAKDHEHVTQFFFERFKTPAFSMVDSATAAGYAYGIPTATIVDIGHTKADVTCFADFLLHDSTRSAAVEHCGGEAMTQRLVELLSAKTGFNREICDQLKRSNICEILPSDEEIPSNTAPEEVSNPAAAASTGIDPASERRNSATAVGAVPRGPGPGTEVGEEKKLEDEEGVLDIASIVTGGNMGEYLAQKEREKAEKVAAKQQKKAGDNVANTGPRAVKLSNSKRARNTFIYEDLTLRDAMTNAGVNNKVAEMASALENHMPAESAEDAAGQDIPTESTAAFKREIEVGTERFHAASGGILDRLADTIFRTIQSCSDINKRTDLWDNMIIVGNGAKVRGFKEALLSRLSAKYLISPSSATIFTSELPSNLSTPIATGANTPQPQHHGQFHHPGGVNPLLLAATTAQNPHLAPPGSMGGQSFMHHTTHTSHGQTPTSIKLAKIPEYFPEWKDVGYDEATFLGAQVAAKVLFISDSGQSNGYMMRTHYNEVGPGGIHEVYL